MSKELKALEKTNGTNVGEKKKSKRKRHVNIGSIEILMMSAYT